MQRAFGTARYICGSCVRKTANCRFCCKDAPSTRSLFVAVEMKHAYSKLSFLATAGNGYTGAANLTQVQITGGIYATGTLDMVAGTVDPAGTATGALTLAAGEKALVVPMAAKPTLAVTCTIDGEEFTTSITADTMPSLLAGVEYEITLTASLRLYQPAALHQVFPEILRLFPQGIRPFLQTERGACTWLLPIITTI